MDECVIYEAELNLYFCVWLWPYRTVLHIHDNHLQILKGHALGFFLAQNPVFYVIPGPLFLKFCFGRRLLLLHKVPTYTTFLTVHIEPPLHVTPPYALKNDPMGLQQSFPARRDPGAPGNAIERSELSLVWPNTHASILVVLYLWDGVSITLFDCKSSRRQNAV